LKLGHFGKWIRNTWKVLECGGGEGWRRSVRPGLVRKEEVLLRFYKQRNILYILQRRKGKWIDGTLFRNCLLTHGMEKKM